LWISYSGSSVFLLVPPKVTTKSVRLNGTQSQEFALRCGATGDPAPKFDFTKVCVYDFTMHQSQIYANVYVSTHVPALN